MQISDLVSALMFRCPGDQVSTRPSSQSPSRRRWRKVWRCWWQWASRYSWAIGKRCSTAPPHHCAPRWCHSTPACWLPWVLMRSCASSTRPPPQAWTCRTSRSSRNLGEWSTAASSNPGDSNVVFVICMLFSEGPLMTVSWWRVWFWPRRWPTVAWLVWRRPRSASFSSACLRPKPMWVTSKFDHMKDGGLRIHIESYKVSQCDERTH